MIAETNDKRFIDSNQDKPRIVYRNNFTVTTNITQGSYVIGTNYVNLKQIKASANTLVEIYMKDVQSSQVYSVPLLTGNSSGQFVLNAYYYLASEDVDIGNGQFRTVQYINGNVQKRGGSLTDTYIFYYVVYSTNINDNLIMGKYA